MSERWNVVIGLVVIRGKQGDMLWNAEMVRTKLRTEPKKQTTPSNTTKQDIINDLDECRDTIASFIAKSTVVYQAKWGNLPDN